MIGSENFNEEHVARAGLALKRTNSGCVIFGTLPAVILTAAPRLTSPFTKRIRFQIPQSFAVIKADGPVRVYAHIYIKEILIKGPIFCDFKIK